MKTIKHFFVVSVVLGMLWSCGNTGNTSDSKTDSLANTEQTDGMAASPSKLAKLSLINTDDNPEMVRFIYDERGALKEAYYYSSYYRLAYNANNQLSHIEQADGPGELTLKYWNLDWSDGEITEVIMGDLIDGEWVPDSKFRISYTNGQMTRIDVLSYDESWEPDHIRKIAYPAADSAVVTYYRNENDTEPFRSSSFSFFDVDNPMYDAGFLWDEDQPLWPHMVRAVTHHIDADEKISFTYQYTENKDRQPIELVETRANQQTIYYYHY